MNAMKICIIVLVLIGVLATFGMGASFIGGEDKNSGTPEPWTVALRDVAAKPRSLRLDELQQTNPDCPVQDPLRVRATCRYTVAKSNDLLGATRRLSLRLSEGDAASIVLRQTGYLTTKVDVTPSESDIDLDIFKEKAATPSELSIVCNSLDECLFTLTE
ncbi:MAG: hypothetical protein M3441_19025 [Chloroflexota bacterium]|nr:hypothetical protein [Chloroflexota bacterium]